MKQDFTIKGQQALELMVHGYKMEPDVEQISYCYFDINRLRFYSVLRSSVLPMFAEYLTNASMMQVLWRKHQEE